MFLDLDGTLFDIVDRPDEVFADESALRLLLQLTERLEGRVAVVSGRSLEQIDAILGSGSTGLLLSGSHGAEHRWDGVAARPERPTALDDVAERLKPLAESVKGVLIEEKSFGVAIHYRLAPHFEASARFLAEEIATEFGMTVQLGHMVAEVRVPGGDKGKAIAAMMRRGEFAGTRPVFAGDDVTDEPGFEVVEALGGSGVLVGPPRNSAASYSVPNPASLREWLWRAAT